MDYKIEPAILKRRCDKCRREFLTDEFESAGRCEDCFEDINKEQLDLFVRNLIREDMCFVGEHFAYMSINIGYLMDRSIKAKWPQADKELIDGYIIALDDLACNHLYDITLNPNWSRDNSFKRMIVYRTGI